MSKNELDASVFTSDKMFPKVLMYTTQNKEKGKYCHLHSWTRLQLHFPFACDLITHCHRCGVYSGNDSHRHPEVRPQVYRAGARR